MGAFPQTALSARQPLLPPQCGAGSHCLDSSTCWRAQLLLGFCSGPGRAWAFAAPTPAAAETPVAVAMAATWHDVEPGVCLPTSSARTCALRTRASTTAPPLPQKHLPRLLGSGVHEKCARPLSPPPLSPQSPTTSIISSSSAAPVPVPLIWQGELTLCWGPVRTKKTHICCRSPLPPKKSKLSGGAARGRGAGATGARKKRTSARGARRGASCVT